MNNVGCRVKDMEGHFTFNISCCLPSTRSDKVKINGYCLFSAWELITKQLSGNNGKKDIPTQNHRGLGEIQR